MEEQKEYPTITTCVMDSDRNLRQRLYNDMCYRDEEEMRRGLEWKYRCLDRHARSNIERMFWQLVKDLKSIPGYKTLVDKYEYEFAEMKRKEDEEERSIQEYRNEKEAEKYEKYERWRAKAAAGLPREEWYYI